MDNYQIESYSGAEIEALLDKIDDLGSASQSTAGLMSAADKTKLDGLDSGAQANVLEGVKIAGADLPIAEKKVNIPVDSSPTSGSNSLVRSGGVFNAIKDFITRSVNDLVNYYTKSDTYTKTDVNNIIGSLNQFHYEIYASTSAVTNPQPNVLYLIGPTGTGSDKYEEYVYSNGWVKIGDTTIDLSGYSTTEQMNAAINNALKDYATKEEVSQLVNELPNIEDSGNNADLDIADPAGYVLARFKDGHFQTKNFNSAENNANIGIDNVSDFDETETYSAGDVVKYNGLLYKFIAEHSGAWDESDVEQTTIIEMSKSGGVSVEDSGNDADLDIADPAGYVLARFKDGHFQTKNFNSKDFPKNHWGGKKIVWYGTSIPAGYPKQNNQNVWAYPNLIAQKLGADIQNYCVPNGVIRRFNHDGSGIDARTELSFTNLDSPINYKTHMVDLIGTVNEPDLFVFDYGVNDCAQDAYEFQHADDIDYFSMSTNTFVGSFGFVLNQLFMAKPLARVIILTHFSDDGVQNDTGYYGKGVWKYLNDVIQRVAEFWNIRLIDARHLTGWHNTKASIISDGNNNISNYVADGIHPASETTTHSVDLLAEIYYNIIKNFN